MTTPDLFAARLAAVARTIDAELARLLDDAPVPGETVRPARLLAAMRHGALAGGKRLRPFLVIETAALFGVPQAAALPAASSLELVHCYSLVHDDLPAMDDDEVRRGRPTVHVAYDQATAILVGDCLLTLAFDVLGRPSTHPDASVRADLVLALARAAGLGGMAGGQMLDLEAEGRFTPDGRPLALDEAAVIGLQRMKTGALLACACSAGAILGRAEPEARTALAGYGQALGLAFQIADDLLDAEGDAAATGKAVRKDAARGKATMVGLLGRAGAHARLDALVAEAEAALAPFGARADMLGAAARFIAARKG